MFGMPRTLALVFSLFALSASAVPLAPLEPRIGPAPYVNVSPAVATNGTSTLLVWRSSLPPHFENGQLHARLLGTHDGGISLGYGTSHVVAWNGSEYLVAYGHAASRSGPNVSPSVTLEIVRPDGTRGAGRSIFVGDFTSVRPSAIVWDGDEWIVAVNENVPRVFALDRNLDVVRDVSYPAGQRVRVAESGGRVWTLLTRDGRTEVFDDGARFSIAGEVRLAGPLAFVERNDALAVATFDPHAGFGALQVRFTGVNYFAAIAFGSGAKIAYHSEDMVRTAVLDARGEVVETADVAAQAGRFGSVALTPDAVFFENAAMPRQIVAYPPGEIVSVVDQAAQRTPVIVATGDHATVFWRQTTADGEETLTRKVDANGIPFGEITRVPIDSLAEADAVFDGTRIVVVWSSSGSIYAWDGGSVRLLGRGTSPAIATSPHGTFVVWTNHDHDDVWGTPFPQNVPGGFPILPSLSARQNVNDIIPLGDGFMVLWTDEALRSVILSPAGAVRSASVFATDPATWLVTAGGTLAAWRSTLFAYTPEGRPYQPFTPPWGDVWYPVAIHHLGGQRHHVLIDRHGALFGSVVTMQGAFITDIAPLTLLGVYERPAVARVGDRTIVVHGNRRLEVDAHGGGPFKRRAVRR